MKNNALKISDKAFYHQLEMGKVLAYLASLCRCDMAKTRAMELGMIRSSREVQKHQDAIFEMLQLQEEYSDDWTIGHYSDLSDSISQGTVPGFIMELEDLVALRQNVLSIHTIQEFFGRFKEEEYKIVRDELYHFAEAKEVLAHMARVFDQSNEIRPNASSDLLRITREIDKQIRHATSTFERLKKAYNAQSFLTISEETVVNGRRVLSLPVENKRRISGIIHDYSASGKTAYIEPQEVVVIQNDIQQLLQEKRVEIRRILGELCKRIRPYLLDIQRATASLARIDLLAAKAHMARFFEANPVTINSEMGFDFKEARHPVLVLNFRDQNKKVVPFDLMLKEKKRILILSGPNAGGKTVTMKTVGLIQLMIQCGLPVPLADKSSTSVYSRLFTDIGDSQSLENELSTYSSKISNLRFFLKQASSKTLFLLDEFGSGTDPSIGGAIAEAILEALDAKGAFVVTTTHYANLKVLADRRKSMVNGAMSFNEETLMPDFRLLVGQPGNSYAFEISRRLGIPEKILKKAERIADSGQVKLEKILQNLQSQELALQDKLIAAEQNNSKLQSLITNYESLKSELDYRRKRLRLESKELEMQLRNKLDQELETLKKNLEAESQKAIAEAHAKHQERKQKLRKDQEKIKKEIFEEEFKQTGITIEKGTHVRLRNGELQGTVHRKEGNRVWIHTGLLQVEANLTDVVAINEPIERKSSKSIRVDSVRPTTQLKQKLDLRGYSVAEAKPLLESFLDRAVVEKLLSFSIVHGKGSGGLRKALWETLGSYPVQLKYQYAAEDFGGKGKTLVTFK